MNPTDELRRMLDERGVEWMPSVFDPQHETFYSVENGVGFIVTEFSEIGRMSLACDMRITPEQAIAATLGDAGLADENAELRRACSELRWMLGADRCIRCDRACEDRGRCPLDEWLESLGVTVPLQREVGHVSQCREEDEVDE